MRKISIHGVPRSGTTFVGELLNSSPNVIYRYQPLFSYALKDFLGTNPDRERVVDFFQRLHVTEDDFLNQVEARRAGRMPVFKKDVITHTAYKEVRYHHLLPGLVEANEEIAFVFVLRNPLGVIHSWLNAPREFRSDLGWKRLEEWRHAEKKNLGRPEEFNGFERWKVATRSFLRLKAEYPDRVICMRYDCLLKNRFDETRKMFEFLQLPWQAQTEEFLSSTLACRSEGKGAYSVMKTYSSDDRWRFGLEDSIADAIREDLSGTELEFLIHAS